MKRICVFCGSSPGNSPDYASAARGLAETLVDQDLGLVFGGSSKGIMGVLSVDAEPAELLTKFRRYDAPVIEKWTN